MFLVWQVRLIVARLAIEQSMRAGASAQTVGFYLAMMSLIALPIRLGVWVTILLAIFGGREAAQSDQSQRVGFQFSIRAVMVLTFVVAVLCAAVRTLAGLMGESALLLLTMIDEVPIVGCWLIGIVIATTRWSIHPQVSKAAISGFALDFTALLMGQSLRLWAIASHNTTYMPMLFTLADVLLTAAAWAFIIVAALGWRGNAREELAPDLEGVKRAT